MNNLSWFLYFADVLPGLFVPVFVVLSLALGAGALCGFIGFMSFHADGSAVGKATYDHVAKYAGKLIFFWVVLLLIVSLTPQKETFYLIAGSELGEQVVKTPEAQEILNDIRKVIKQQIKAEKTVVVTE